LRLKENMSRVTFVGWPKRPPLQLLISRNEGRDQEGAVLFAEQRIAGVGAFHHFDGHIGLAGNPDDVVSGHDGGDAS
jgi:hypothetical protein